MTQTQLLREFSQLPLQQQIEVVQAATIYPIESIFSIKGGETEFLVTLRDFQSGD